MGEPYEYERKLEGEGFCVWKLRDKIFSRDWVSCVPLDLGFLPQCVKQPFFSSFFLWCSTFVPRGIFSRLGGHRGKSWCWPTFWGEFCPVQQQPKGLSELLYFCKLSVLVTWPRLVRNLWSTICRTSSTLTPSPSPSHAPASQGWISMASSKLISVHFFKIDISPSLQSWYQSIPLKLISVHPFKADRPVSSCSNRLIFPVPTGTVETSQVLATKIDRADWWQIRLEAFLTEFMSTLFFHRKLSRLSMQ